MIPLNLNEFYQLECYDTAIKGQSKQQFDIDNEDDGIVVDHASAFKLNSFKYYSQIEDNKNPALKLLSRKDSFFGETSIREEDSSDEKEEEGASYNKIHEPRGVLSSQNL